MAEPIKVLMRSSFSAPFRGKPGHSGVISYRHFLPGLQHIFRGEFVGGCSVSNGLNELISHHGLVLTAGGGVENR